MKGILARLDKRKEVQRHQSTRQLMGISSITDHGVSTPYGDYTFFLIRPDNLSVLSEDAIRQRVGNLANLLSNRDEVTIMALDSRASFQHNKLFYQARLEEETEPAIRRLLQLDLEHLDEIQASSASKREFVIALRVTEKEGHDPVILHQMEKSISNENIPVRLAEREDIKRLLAVYYLNDAAVTAEEDVDGEKKGRCENSGAPAEGVPGYDRPRSGQIQYRELCFRHYLSQYHGPERIPAHHGGPGPPVSPE